MKKLPEWLVKIAKKYSCPRCGLPIDLKRIVGIGIKESYKIKGKEVLFFEYFCTNCEDMYVFELDFMPTDELIASMMMPEDDDQNCIGRSEVKSGITDREVNELKKFLRFSTSYEDFLEEIGIPKKEIERQNKKFEHRGRGK